MLIFGVGRFQYFAMHAGVKEEKYFPSIFDMIMVLASTHGKIQLITLAEGKLSGYVATIMIMDIIMFSYIGVSSNPAFETF